MTSLEVRMQGDIQTMDSVLRRSQEHTSESIISRADAVHDDA